MSVWAAGHRFWVLVTAAWLVLALLVGTFWGLGLRACQYSGPFSDGLSRYCQSVTSLDREAQRALILQDQLDRLNSSVRLANSCPAPQCPEPTERDLIILMDRSHSMGFALDSDQANRAPNRRLDFAQRAIGDLIDRTPDPQSIAYLSFAQCGPPRMHGRFEARDRERLRAVVMADGTRDNTALADALAFLPSVLREAQGETVPANVVLVADGEDNCSGDPCAEARLLATNFPDLTVNVVSIGGNVEKARCIAESTGGIVVEARNAASLTEAMAQAAIQDLPLECRPIAGSLGARGMTP